MLTLAPESSCDICADTYTAETLPHSIPCGHTFCRPCLDKICEGLWSPRLPPACPLCREPFAAQHIRLIRIDLAPAASYRDSSPPLGLGYPHSAHPYSAQYPSATVHRELGLGPRGLGGRGVVAEEDNHHAGGDEDRVRAEARALEEKVSKAASTRCTFEEVSALQREIEDWLQKELVRRPDKEHASLRLSAMLLGAILVNGFAYNEAKKVAKGVEVSLKDKLEAVELVKKKLETELHRQRTQYNDTVREVQRLNLEMSRLKGIPPPPLPLGSALGSGLGSALGSGLGSALGSGLVTPPALVSPPRASPSRPQSTAPSARSSTPAPTSTRSATPAPRSSTPAPSATASGYASYSHFPNPRPHTPAPSSSSHTASSVPSLARSSVSPTRASALSQSTSYLPTAALLQEQRERWLPPESGGGGGGHARAQSLSRAASGIVRPRTAGPGSAAAQAGWGRGIAM